MTEESQSLDSMLNDEPEDTVEAQEAETVSETPEPTETPAEARERDENGRFAAKTGVEEETVPPTDKLPQEDYKAIREEREKRQKLEQELEALRQQINQASQEPPPPPPSVWEDENAWGGQLVNTAVQQATTNARLDMSEMMVRQANEDFEEVKAQFLDMAKDNPSLAQQALADPHPWKKAYDMAKNHTAMSELGAVNVADLEAKLRAQIMAEMQQGETPAYQASVPPSITGQRNVGARSGPAWSGPKSLSDMLG
jgi:hypothetical protein